MKQAKQPTTSFVFRAFPSPGFACGVVQGCGPNKERVGRVPIQVVGLATRSDSVVGDEAANSVFLLRGDGWDNEF